MSPGTARVVWSRTIAPSRVGAWHFIVLLVFMLALSNVPSLAVETESECLDRDRDGFGAGSACGGQVDCQDLYLPVNPVGIEHCNGLDDDCSGIVDEGCERACSSREPFRFGTPLFGPPVNPMRAPQLVRTPNGFGLSWQQLGVETSGAVNNCAYREFTVLDGNGRPTMAPVRVAGGPGLRFQAAGNSDLAWTGGEYWIGAQDGPVNSCSASSADEQVYVRRLSLSGEVLGSPIRPNCSVAFSDMGSLVWTGFEMVVFFHTYDGFSDGSYARIYDPHGAPLSDCIPIDLDDSSQDVYAWNGQEFGRAFIRVPDGEPAINGELYFERLNASLEHIDLEPLRLTFDGNYTGYPDIVWTGQRWGVAAASRMEGDIDVVLFLVSADGELVTPPGMIQITDSAGSGESFDLPDLVWNGEEFAVFYQDSNPGPDVRGEILMARVDASGFHYEPDIVVTSGPVAASLFHESGWDGSTFVTATDYLAPTSDYLEIRIQRTGCVCTDLDGDQFSTCLGGDCSDGDPLVNVLAQEICGNGVDDDCDGLRDCMDVEDCPALGQPPSAVEQLLILDDEETLSWNSVAGAERYDVVRGRLWDLPYFGVSSTECLESNISNTSAEDLSIPVLGDGFYYLVRAETGAPSSCLVSTWGSADRDEDDSGCP